MNVRIETIEHKDQRYETLGDWYFEGENLVIRVSKLGDWRSEMLIALHEFVEVAICKANGISQEQVDKFDLACPDSDDPGDELDAPYRDQHCFAMSVERMVAAAMKYAWKFHEDRLSDVERHKVER